MTDADKDAFRETINRHHDDATDYLRATDYMEKAPSGSDDLRASEAKTTMNNIEQRHRDPAEPEANVGIQMYEKYCDGLAGVPDHEREKALDDLPKDFQESTRERVINRQDQAQEMTGKTGSALREEIQRDYLEATDRGRSFQKRQQQTTTSTTDDQREDKELQPHAPTPDRSHYSGTSYGV